MKTSTVLRMAGGILIALASVHTWSQTSEQSAASSGSAIAASAGVTANETRQANRALRRKVYAATRRKPRETSASLQGEER
ncbi:hypothetical protein P3T16_002309 [Paraburkholderia sp. GAS42]